jgi:hypothetical protein
MTSTDTRLLGTIVGLIIALGVTSVENRIEQRVRGNVALHWLSLPGGYEVSHQTTRSGWGVFWYSPDGVRTDQRSACESRPGSFPQWCLDFLGEHGWCRLQTEGLSGIASNTHIPIAAATFAQVLLALEAAQVHGRHGQRTVVQEATHVFDALPGVAPQLADGHSDSSGAIVSRSLPQAASAVTMAS